MYIYIKKKSCPPPPSKNLLVFLVGRSTFGCCFSAALHCLPPLPLENSCLIKKQLLAVQPLKILLWGGDCCVVSIFLLSVLFCGLLLFGVDPEKQFSKSGINIFPRQKDSNLFITSLKSGLRWGLNHSNESCLCYGCLCVVSLGNYTV